MMSIENNEVTKKSNAPSVVLGILGIVFSCFVPAVSFACSIPGVIMGIKNRRKSNTGVSGIALNIVALSIAFINSLLAVVITIKIFAKCKKKKKA